jgi:hypothetical protein
MMVASYFCQYKNQNAAQSVEDILINFFLVTKYKLKIKWRRQFFTSLTD